MLCLVSLQFSLSFALKDHFDVMRQFYSGQIVKQSWSVFEVQNTKLCCSLYLGDNAGLEFILGGQRWLEFRFVGSGVYWGQLCQKRRQSLLLWLKGLSSLLLWDAPPAGNATRLFVVNSLKQC